MEPVQLAAILALVVVLASIVSVELGIAVALLELGFGVVVGNLFSLHSQEWLDFVASFASIVLTFLAGLEIEPAYFRERFAASVAIGLVSFAGPFLIGAGVAYLLLGWTVKAALIAGTALSTTSLAVIYAVLVEDGLNETRIGKLLMSATFVTDMATAIALTAIFIKPSVWFPVFVVVSVGLVLALPRIARPFFRRYGDRVIEPEIKLVFVCLFLLMVLADAAHGHAVLPAFVLGLAMSNHFAEHRQEQQRLRVVSFAFLTPFFFIRGGLNVSLGAVFANLGLLGVLFAAKLVPKLALVYPVARRHMGEHTTFGTLLMSTGLTFGTIASLFGLNAGIIDTTQFSLLITVVVLSAILPTAIAQRFFSPDREAELASDRGAKAEPVPIPAEEYV
jgi:Kef-type K+ transport system membrane component KefB